MPERSNRRAGDGGLISPPTLQRRNTLPQGVQVAFRGSARDFGSPVQVGNPASHPPPSARPLGVAFPGTVDAQVIPVVQGRFGAQHTPDRGKGFVVKLHRVAVQGVLDADPFLTLPQIADHFAVKALRDLSTRRKASAQIAHHVLAAQGGQGVVQQPRVEVPERRGTSEDHIRGPLALVGGPVIAGLEGTEDRFVRRVQLSGDLVQPARPLYSQLRIQQSLRVGPVFHPGKAVVLPHKLQARGRHLPGQPLPSVQADLDGEGKPSLNARVHETPAGMNRVVVKKQAFSPTLRQVQLLRLAIAVDLKTPTELHRGQDANQPLANALLGGDLPRQGFLVRLRGSQVLDGSPQLDRFRQRSLLQLLAHLLHVATEVLPQNLVHRQVSVHAVDVGKGPQRPSKNQSVKPRKYSRNLISVFCDKLLHGVSVPPRMRGLRITNTSYRNRAAFFIWLRLCRAASDPLCRGTRLLYPTQLVFENAEEIFNLVGLTPSAATRSRPGEYNSVTAVWMTSSNASTTRSDLWMSLSRPLPYPRHAVFLKTLETVLLTKKGCARFCACLRTKPS